MKGYPEYKDSGIEWLVRIPKHWNTDKFFRVSYMKGRIGWQGLKQSEFVDDLSLPYLITGMNFKNGVINWEEVYHITEERYAEAPEIQLQNDDVLMTKDGTIGKLLYVDHLPNKTSLNSHLLVLRPLDKKFVPRFIYYELQSEHFKNHVEQVKTGTTFYGITQEGTGQFKVLLPPIIEQSQIATFLDNKSRQIDNLIAKKQKLIELLQEERTAIINQAVTKGLDSSVPMKDSGIEWMGEIPEHWKVKRLKFLVDNIIEKSDINDFKVALENIESLTGCYIRTENSSELSGEMKSFKKSDVLFSKLRPYLAKVYLPDTEGECVGELIVLRSSSLFVPKFLYYRLLSRDFIEIVNGSTYGAKMPRASWEDFIRNLLIPFPAITEQEAIIKKIDLLTTTISAALKKLNYEIDLLSEYKTSLINEAVTGKIDVRDYQINHA